MIEKWSELMMDFYVMSFYFISFTCPIFYYFSHQKQKGSSDASFLNLQTTYLLVYVLAMAGDWLQGPYVYALYDYYGMTKHQIELLFVVGFGSSMVLGTFVGSMADRYGRKAFSILYAVLYISSCVTKHFNNFWILLVGRLLGGTATSLLCSSFESWLICEHKSRGIDADLLGTIFSRAVLGNSIVAILSAVAAQYAADKFGYVAPFDLAILVLTLMALAVTWRWTENYGDAAASTWQSLTAAGGAIRTNAGVACLGAIQSLFEGSMYCFVLEWTPALTPPAPAALPVTPVAARTGSGGQPAAAAVSGRRLQSAGVARDFDRWVLSGGRLLSSSSSPRSDSTPAAASGPHHTAAIPHGYIFATFMVAMMLGSFIFNHLHRRFQIESFMRIILVISAGCLALPFLAPGHTYCIFVGFLVFEMCVGIFWPSMSTMRGKYVPEEVRATVMNFFRIPLNLIVIIILSQNLALQTIFRFCTGFLLISAIFQQWLYRLSLAKKSELVSRSFHPQDVEESVEHCLLRKSSAKIVPA